MPGYRQAGDHRQRGYEWQYKREVLKVVNGMLFLQDVFIRFNIAAIVMLRVQGRSGLGKLLRFNIIEFAAISMEAGAIVMIAEMRFEIQRINAENKEEKYGASFSHGVKVDKKRSP